jgi:hypothetical protein
MSCSVVSGGGLCGELRDTGQRLMQPGRAALPFAPELEETSLGNPGPIRPERLDTARELAQGPVDLASAGVEPTGQMA